MDATHFKAFLNRQLLQENFAFYDNLSCNDGPMHVSGLLTVQVFRPPALVIEIASVLTQ